MRIKRLGSIAEDVIAIVVHEATLEEIIDYSHWNVHREVGGFLIGALVEGARPFVEVAHFLPARDARSKAASLTFTHETWASMNRAVQKQYAGEKVVGWYHTHPGLGVFLSEYDLFIHQHYFTAPYHVALVVDPQRQEFGYFQWRGGEIVDCGFYLIYEPRETTVK